MKKIVLILVLSVFAFSSSGFKKAETLEESCFDIAREIVLEVDGEINTDNVSIVNWLNFLCEQEVILFP
jgi:pentose-5-phosphate-3-epimerase